MHRIAVTARSARWGVAAAAALMSLYMAILLAASGWSHLRDQASQDWWLLTPIIAGFGLQVAFTAELRARHLAHHLGASTGAGTGASTVGMVACCAHHLADLVPLLGATGLAAFLLDWRVPLMVFGLAVNGVAAVIAGRRLAALTPKVAACHA